jgi:hypothetical protein
MLTQEQIDIFNQHFQLTEIATEISKYVYDINAEQLNKLTNPNDISYLHGTVVESYVDDSHGYIIVWKESQKAITDVYEIKDIVNFIKNDMSKAIDDNTVLEGF